MYNGTIGEIRYFSGDFLPKGWFACDGNQYCVKKYEVLFSIIKFNYGGDGRDEFAVPTIPDQDGCKAVICYEGIYPQRD